MGKARRTYAVIAGFVATTLVGGLLFALVSGDPDAGLVAQGGARPALSAAGSNTEVATSDGVDVLASTEPGAATATTARQAGASALPGAKVGPGASDVGVTTTTIKLGVVLLDLEAVGPLGLALENFDVETQKKVFQAYIDDINRRGGINGRSVQPVYVKNDVLATTDPGQARAQCLQLTSDLKVFAVVGYISDATGCVVGEQRTPVVKYTADLEESYTRSGNYLISPTQTYERMAADWVGALEDLGHLRGKKIGMVAGEVPDEERTASAAQRTLQKLGYEVTYRARLSSDASAAQAQVPLEVQRMRNAGVDFVMLPTNFAMAIAWVQTAEGQEWRPRYTTSDFEALATNALVRGMPESFEGAIGLTSSTGGRFEDGRRPAESAEEASCRELYNSTTEGKDFAWGEEQPMYQICGIVRAFDRGATRAGPALTRGGFVAGIQALGQIAWATQLGGSLGNGKTDYADFVKPLRWAYACKCYYTTGEPMRVRY